MPIHGYSFRISAYFVCFRTSFLPVAIRLLRRAAARGSAPPKRLYVRCFRIPFLFSRSLTAIDAYLPYIPIAEARGFTAVWVKMNEVSNQILGTKTVQER